MPSRMEPRPLLLALVLAPLVFVVVALVSGVAEPAKRVLQAWGLLVVVALPVGLITPVLGASAGFGLGITLTLNPPRFSNVLRNRLVAVLASVAYTLLLLVVITPAGVFAGAYLPPLMVAIADEYSAWRSVARR